MNCIHSQPSIEHTHTHHFHLVRTFVYTFPPQQNGKYTHMYGYYALRLNGRQAAVVLRFSFLIYIMMDDGQQFRSIYIYICIYIYEFSIYTNLQLRCEWSICGCFWLTRFDVFGHIVLVLNALIVRNELHLYDVICINLFGLKHKWVYCTFCYYICQRNMWWILK